MSVTTEEIKNIKPGTIEPFSCESGKMYSIATMITQIKRRGMPDGVVDYEHQKFFDKGIILIRPLREGDTKILNL